MHSSRTAERTRLPARGLMTGYAAEVDAIGEAGWYRILQEFGDASIYQTWSYDAVRCTAKNLSHLVLKRHGEVVAAAQARLVKLPFLPVGVAYIRWGPVWRRRSQPADPEVFRQAVRALRNEFACRRGLVLRLYPVLFRETSAAERAVLEEEGFAACEGERVDRTLVFELNQPVEVLRKGLRPHWQRYLKVAEKNGLEIVEGTGDDLFATFIQIYKEMVGRKRFLEPNQIEHFRSVQQRLPEQFRMQIMLCRSAGQVCAGLVACAAGDTAIYLFGATSNAGLRARGSYLLHWRMIQWLKERGVTRYDLHGIDPLRNPGTYKFKADLCGENGSDLSFLGRFDASGSRTAAAIVRGADWLRNGLRGGRRRAAEGIGRAAAPPARPAPAGD